MQKPYEFKRLCLLNKLSEYPTLLSSAALLATPVFTHGIPTAAVAYIKDKIVFLLNPDFMNSLSEHEECFVFSHEALHIYFNHLDIIKENNLNAEKANYAGDIIINEILKSQYNFTEANTPILNKGVLAKTIFPEYENIPSSTIIHKGFWFFYEKLDDDLIKKCESFDFHDLNSANKNQIAEDIQEQVDINIDNPEEIQDKPSDIHKKAIEKHLNTFKLDKKLFNNDVLGDTEDKNIESIHRKQQTSKTWEKLIKIIKPNLLKIAKQSEESFAEIDYGIQMLLPSKMRMPKIINTEFLAKDKIDLYFFMDTSGSCTHYFEEFIRIVNEIPTQYFELHLFNFDEKVYPIQLNSNNEKNIKIQHGWGNNSFNILEKQIQNDLNNKKIKKYPPFICVLTDGIVPPLTDVTPNHEKNWLFIIISGKKGDIFNDKKVQFNYLMDLIKNNNVIPNNCRIIPSHELD